MTKNDNSDYISGLIFFIVVIALIIGYYLMKYAIIGVVILIIIIKYLIKKYKESSITKTVNNMVENAFSNSIIKPTEKITKNQVKEKLELFDIDIYNDLFEDQIRERGQEYFAQGEVKNVKQKDNKWSCTIGEDNKYNVSINFSDDKITKVNCNCSYHKKDNKNCKHIYALLLEAKSKRNIPIILKAIADYANSMTKMINEESKYIDDNKEKIKSSTETILQYQNDANKLIKEIKIMIKDIEKNQKNESLLLDNLVKLIKGSCLHIQKFETFLINTRK